MPAGADRTAEHLSTSRAELSPSRDATLTSFVGRRSELQQIHALLTERGARLVTLTGPSGVGKSRVAMQAMAELEAHFEPNIWFVDLGHVDDPGLVGVTIARSIGAPPSPGGFHEDVIASFLGSRTSLLVLDGFEHLVEATPVLGRLLMNAPGLRLLVTSQSLLRLSGEHSLTIEPLGVPETGGANSTASASDAIKLFLDRARAIRQDFGRQDGDAESIAEIVRRLDGIPLAIEIAASRANMLTPQSLLSRLDEDLLDFADVRGDRPARQQTLRAAIAWSYGLLSETERCVFRRLAVFRGGFSLEAAERLSAMPDYLEFLEVLSSLVDHSLVRRLTGSFASERFEILAAPREFALQELAISGEEVKTRRVHLEWAIETGEDSEEELLGPRQAEWLARLSSEQGNFRTALHWALDQGDAKSALRLASALWRFWATIGGLAEARDWLSQAISLAGDEWFTLRAKALHHHGNVALDMGDFAAARQSYEASHSIVEQSDDVIALARSFNGLGLVSFFQGRLGDARGFHLRALELRTEAGDPYGLALSHTNLGDVLLAMGDPAGARIQHETALSLHRKRSDQIGMAYSTFNLGMVALTEGAPERARLLFEDALLVMEASGDRTGSAYALMGLVRANRRLDNRVASSGQLLRALDIRMVIGDRWGTVECLEEVASLAGEAGHLPDAAELFAATQREREQMTAPLAPADLATRRRELEALKKSLGEKAFADHTYAGALRGVAQAVDRARALLEQHIARPRSAQEATGGHEASRLLSPRELEVLRLVAQGFTDREIADALFMSRRTATTHQANIRQKLGVQNRAEAVALATREGLL